MEVGQNELQLIINKLTMVFLNLKDKILFNKTRRRVSITCMEKALMPQEYGMKLIGYKGLNISYAK